MKTFQTVLIALAFAVSVFAQAPKSAHASRIMVVAHPLAAKAGLEVYKKGGNVVDAAVATAYALGVVEPYGSGIGGEGMMLIYSAATGKYTIIDFKAIAPAAAGYESLNFHKTSEWARSNKGASVPGAVAGLELARDKYGKLDRATVLQPAIDFALNGFEVDSSVALNLASYRKTLERDPYSLKVFYPGGKPAKQGTILKNPDYGTTLALIRDGGAEEFYRGRIASLIAEDARTNGGFITREDLAAYRPIIRAPLVGSYRGFTVVTTPPPCGGMHLLEALNILSYFDLGHAQRQNGYSIHLLSEAFKLMFKDEAAHNGDPEFEQIHPDFIASPEYAFQRFRKIDLNHPTPASSVKPGNLEEQSTTHLSVMDNEGNAVALTITLSSLFGTAHTVEGGGFLLNNEMQNYNPDSTHPNSWKPHKRVVTSLVPTILEQNGVPRYVIGTPGGDLIISTIAQIVVNLVDLRLPLTEAVDAPRMFSTFYQEEVEGENRLPSATIKRLEGLGHTVKPLGPYRAYFGAVQAVERNPATGQLIGCGDPRRSGAAIGE